MKSGELAVVVEIPSGFGRDLASLHPPEVAVWIDGAMPFRGETAKGYVTGLGLRYAQDLVVERLGPNAVSNVYLGGLNLEDRFRYNQGFKSVFAMVPSVIVMMLILIPAIMATIAVVLEKETGSIANFRSTPISKFEFLLGKAFPYVVVGMLTFTLLLLMSFFVFHVPVKGSFAALALGHAALRFLDLRLRATRLDLHPDTGSGSLCDYRSRRHPHSELFRSARARVLPHWPGKIYRPDVSSGLVPADQRRHLHQRHLAFPICG